MDGIGFLIVIASFVMAIIALNKTAKLDTVTAQLKMQLTQLKEELAKLRRDGSAPSAEPEPEVAAVAEALIAPPPEQPIITEAPANANAAPELPPLPPPKPPKPIRDMEQALASRWFVWIGGVAIAVGGLLFVKYAYDNGLISPTLQIILGLMIAAVLVAAGEFLRRRDPAAAPDNYVPAALSAAGIATAFAAIYAAYALYQLVGPTTAFAGLALVGLGAMALSRVQGPFIAALGLIGSYATPALVSTDSPSALGFFPYLAVILGASLFTLRGRNWWWLGFAAVAGSLLWTLGWFLGPYALQDTLIIGLFAHVVGLVSFYGLRGRANLGDEPGSRLFSADNWQPLAIGFMGLAAQSIILFKLLHISGHSNTALVLFFLGVASLAAIAWLKPGASVLAPVAAGLGFAAMMVWDEVAFHELAMDERGFWSSLLGGDAPRFLNWTLGAGAALTVAGLAGVKLRPEKWLWALLASLASVLYIVGAWGRVDALLSPTVWLVIAVVTAAVLLAVAKTNHKEVGGANLPAGILAAGAAVLLIFAADRLFDNVWLTLAIAVLAAGYAFGSRLLQASLMGPVTATLASLVAVKLFVSRELWNDDRTLPLGQHWPLYGYGLPAVLFLIASRWLKSSGHLRSAVALEGISLGLAMSLVSLELRVLIAGGIGADEPALLEVAAHVLTWMAAAYGLMYRQQIYSSFISLWGSRVLLAASAAGVVLLSLLALNPVVTEEPVVGNVVFNALLLAYLAPVVLLGLIARKLSGIGWEMLRPAAGLLALGLVFVYVTLETKRVFQGPVLVAQSESIAESYAYSAVWLVLALALFVAGIRLRRQVVRYAGLGVMTLVVLKVFLWDMSSLEGLYRIASFVGLGLCLVAIGWLYQKFVLKPA